MTEYELKMAQLRKLYWQVIPDMQKAQLIKNWAFSNLELNIVLTDELIAIINTANSDEILQYAKNIQDQYFGLEISNSSIDKRDDLKLTLLDQIMNSPMATHSKHYEFQYGKMLIFLNTEFNYNEPRVKQKVKEMICYIYDPTTFKKIEQNYANAYPKTWYQLSKYALEEVGLIIYSIEFDHNLDECKAILNVDPNYLYQEIESNFLQLRIAKTI